MKGPGKAVMERMAQEHLAKLAHDGPPRGPVPVSRLMFNKYDKDGSGLIDKKEFRAMCYDLGYYLSEGETDVAFRTINVSGDGNISYDEFAQFWRTDKRFEKLQLPEEELKRLQAAIAYFQSFDKDMSGQLDREEFKALHADLVKQKMTTLDVGSCFEELDRDQSGTISFNEYVDWISSAHLPRRKVL
jgi:Ca2+-binding EF-hand superfamily protein